MKKYESYQSGTRLLLPLLMSAASLPAVRRRGRNRLRRLRRLPWETRRARRRSSLSPRESRLRRDRRPKCRLRYSPMLHLAREGGETGGGGAHSLREMERGRAGEGERKRGRKRERAGEGERERGREQLRPCFCVFVASWLSEMAYSNELRVLLRAVPGGRSRLCVGVRGGWSGSRYHLHARMPCRPQLTGHSLDVRQPLL